MARTPYSDPDAEAAYQDIVKNSSVPSAESSRAGMWPENSLGGRSQVEVNNPEAGGPSDDELEKRNANFAKQRQRDRGR